MTIEPNMAAQRLERCLRVQPVQRGAAVRALLAHIGRAVQVKHGRSYVELSVGYIAQAAAVGWETARQAWHAVAALLQWRSTTPSEARAWGAAVRERQPGRLWGRHLLLTPEAVAAARALVPAARPAPSAEGWVPFAPRRAPGGGLVARCPFHDDAHASALLYTNADGCSGPGTCLACLGSDGRPLRFYWRQEGGSYMARPAQYGSAPRAPSLRPAAQAAGTIHRHTAPHTAAPSGVLCRVLGALTGQWMQRRECRAADQGLIELLERADAQAARPEAAEAAHDGAERWALAGGDKRDHVPDAYVSVDLMHAVRWRGFTTGAGVRVSRPTGWRAESVTHVLVDLDGFTAWPEGNGGLQAAGERLARLAQGRAELDGTVAVLRTSPGGVQLVYQLAQAQHEPRAWFASEQARQLCAWLDDWSLRAVQAVGFAGGHADRCVHAAGRMMRRPGPRITKQGEPYVARLACVARVSLAPG